MKSQSLMKDYRGLSEGCFRLIEADAGLKALLDRVGHDPYRLEVRRNYLSCYYHSGSVFKLELSPITPRSPKTRKKRELEFTFDAEYFALKNGAVGAHEDLRTWVKGKPNKPQEWLDHLDELKEVMDAWMEVNPCEEAKSQQVLTKCNTFAHGNYQYIDTELAVYDHQEFGKMDLIAVRREGERYIPVVVELKHGTGAFPDPSGIGDHYRKTMLLLNHPEGDAFLVETIRQIWDTKARLGLLQAPVPDTRAFGKAELMVAVTGWPDGDPAVIRGYLPTTLERKVWAVINPDRDLHFDQAKPLPEKVES